jgi:hypothetical protein
MSGGSSQSTQQLDPAMREAFLNNVTRATGVAEGLQSRQFAGFQPDQQTSFDITRQFADPNSRQMRQVNTAANLATSAGLYSPQQVASRDINAATSQAAQLNRQAVRDVGARDVTGAGVTQEALGAIAPQARANIRDIEAASFLNQNIQQYMNPYTQAVTEQSLRDLERSRQLQQQQTAAQATAAKAFGGSRQGVVEAETNRAFGENAARLAAQQNAAAFQAAQQASEADLTRAMQAQQLNQAQDAATTQQSLQLAGQFGLANQDANLRAALANQGVDLSVGQLNAQNAQQVNLANQAAQNQIAQQNAQNFLQANLANQGAGLQANQQRLGASGQLASVAAQGQQMGLTGAGALAQQGAAQQQLSQAQLDAIRNLPLEQQQIINQALGLNVGGGSGMQQQSSSRQGLLGALGL